MLRRLSGRRRNCADPQQVCTLIGEFRDCVGRDDAPVLIDQEGGRVARLQPPQWRRYPAAARLAALPDPIAEEAVFRGFLYRGWVRTPRAVVPGIIVISALFAVYHVQYDWFGIFIIFSRGLFYGWVRWWSGSTMPRAGFSSCGGSGTSASRGAISCLP